MTFADDRPTDIYHLPTLVCLLGVFVTNTASSEADEPLRLQSESYGR